MKPDTSTIALDEEFKAGLNLLRPHILRLSSVEDAKLTRLWLEKLHDSLDERPLRNFFLKELTQQVQSGKLRYPFNKTPPLTPLYLCQDGSGELYSSTDTYSGSSKYFNLRRTGASSLDEKKVEAKVLGVSGGLRKPWNTSGKVHRKRHGRRKTDDSYKSKEPPKNERGLLSTINSLQSRNEALAEELKLYQGSATEMQKNMESVQQEVIILKNKLEEMKVINAGLEERNSLADADFGKALTESVRRLSERLDIVSKRNMSLEEKMERLRKEKNILSTNSKSEEAEMRAIIRKLKRDLEAERKKRATESHALRALLAQKQKQLAEVDHHVQHQCDRMQKEVSTMKQEINSNNPKQIQPNPKFKEKISGLRKHVYHVEKTNKKILGVFERKLNQYKEECDQKINYLSKQVESKDRLANSLQTALKKAESQYRKHIAELQETCRTQRAFDHQKNPPQQELKDDFVNQPDRTVLSGPHLLLIKAVFKRRCRI